MKGFDTPLWAMGPRKKGEFASNGKGCCDLCHQPIVAGEMISKWLGYWAHSDCKQDVTQVTPEPGNSTA